MSNSAIAGRMIVPNHAFDRTEYVRTLLEALQRKTSLTTVMAGLKTWQVLAFFLLHAPLALVMRTSPTVATMHAVATLLVGLWCAVHDRGRERAAYVTAYMAGAEVLWRMNDSQVFWEFGKYGIAAVLIVAMLRDSKLKPPVLPLIYFALLVPSIFLIVGAAEFAIVRRQISFNLSGPFALMVCCVFFSRQVFTSKQLQRLFVAAIAPILGIAFVAIGHAFSEETINFVRGSNAALSGGWGPNQVSSVLGLGGLLAFLLSLNAKIRPGVRILMLVSSAFLYVQSAVTFSRNGPYLGLGCLLLASFYLLRDKVSRRKLFIGLGALALAAAFVLPRLNSFTGGTLAKRFEDTNSTNRDLIARADIEIWKANPLMGVGPGASYALHALTFRKQAAHTEYSRLVAEHGMFGLVALVLLLIIPLRNLRRAQTPVSKALVTAMAGWALGYFLVNAMRLAAPSYFLGLTCASFVAHEGISPALKLQLARLIGQRRARLSSRVITPKP